MVETGYLLHAPEPGFICETVTSFQRPAAVLARIRSPLLKGAVLIGCLAGLLLISNNQAIISLKARESLVGTAQHFFIVRHGDKYSSYPACPVQDGTICFDEELMGVNPPLTPCGIEQAARTAESLLSWSAEFGGIDNVVVSPYTRTLQTSLPFAQALGKKLHVEYFISEARMPEGPKREFNINAPGETVKQLEECHNLWELSYGGPPIKTPENDTLYIERIPKAVKILKDRFPPSSGNLAVFTHATPALSIAYGLCHGDTGDDKTLEDFVNAQHGIGPAGVIHVILEGTGSCRIEQTRNFGRVDECGETPVFKCDIADFPAWYWPHSGGKGLGRCS